MAAIIIWYHLYHSINNELSTSQSTFQTIITTCPQVKEKTIRAEAQLIWKIDSTNIVSIDRNVMLYISRDSLSEELKQGDSLILRGYITHSNKGNPYEFDYDNWLKEHGIDGIIYVNANQWYKNGHTTLKTPKALSERCRYWFVNQLKRCGLEEDELGVAAAMVVGEKSVLSYETRQFYSAAGVSHVLAVSGLHTGIVFGAIMFLLTGFGFAPLLYKQKRRRWFTCILGICFIWLYAFLTGLSPSVTRAALMITLLYLGVAIGRRQISFNTLAAAAFINLIIEPNALFNVSFQLSYCAVMGIMLFYAPIVKLVSFKNKIFRWTWELIAVSISAQLGTLPLTIWYFQQTSNYFALANIFIIPLATLVIYAAALFALFAATPIGIYLSYPVKYLIVVMNCLVRHIEALPLSTTNISITPTILITLALTIGMIAIYLRKQQWQFLLAVGCTMLLTAGLYVVHLKHIEHTNRIIVYNTYPYTVIAHQKGRSLTLYSDSIHAAQNITLPLRKHEMIHKLQTIKLNDEIDGFNCNNQQFLYLSPHSGHTISLKENIQTNVLLLGGRGNHNLKNILLHSSPQTVILLSTIPKWRDIDIENPEFELYRTQLSAVILH